MKKVGIIIVVLICVSFSSIMFIKGRGVEKYNTSGYSIVVPDKWKVQEHKDLELCTFYYNDEEVASVETYENCEYASSVSSFVSNAFGMHSYKKSEEVIREEKDFQLIKVVVGYEQSAAEMEKEGKIEEREEEHYIWINYKDTVIDLLIDTTRIEESQKKIIVKNFHV